MEESRDISQPWKLTYVHISRERGRGLTGIPVGCAQTFAIAGSGPRMFAVSACPFLEIISLTLSDQRLVLYDSFYSY
jgi:hypothetical protein